MATAVNDLVKNPLKFFIGGEWVAPSSGSQIEVISPGNEEVFGHVAEAQAADMDRAVLAARKAFDFGPWPRLSYAERAAYLVKIARKIEEKSQNFAGVWTGQIGTPAAFTSFVTPLASYHFDYYAGLADTFPWVERHEALHSPGSAIGLLAHEPVGVVGAIVPWNGPLGLLAVKIAPALMAGCTVILKNSPQTPGEGLLFAEVCQEVGLPEGVVNVVTADREVSELLVRNPMVDKITFTGSSAAGKRIASICGERIARVTLELGGKSAGVILDDMNLEEAAESISQTARIMCGQVCSSLTRIVVSKHRHNQFVEALAASFSKVKVGDPYDITTEMGPLAMRQQRDRVEHYIAKGKAEGATLATGGQRPSHLNRGFFIEPTVFGGVDNNMSIAREEIFGPVVSVLPVENEAEAVRVANDTEFGLNATVFTHDANRAYEVARQLRAGTVGHNVWRTDFSIAFGGFKQSGIGREGGIEGLRPFLEAKTIILNDVPDQFK
jgi:aldehyde dehydrogenase (NAD+)